MRKLLVTAALIGVGVLIAGNGAWGNGSGSSAQKLAERYRIDNIEKTWHKAASRKNVDLMMSLWAPKATFTIAGKTYKGRAAIRQVFAKAGPFQTQNHWESDTPAYKVRITVNGDGGRSTSSATTSTWTPRRWRPQWARTRTSGRSTASG